jgi:hypothetical protein
MARSIPPRSLHQKVLTLLDDELQTKNMNTLYREKLQNKELIGLPWLWKLASGEIRSPDVNKMEYLYEVLTNRKLFEDVHVE